MPMFDAIVTSVALGVIAAMSAGLGALGVFWVWLAISKKGKS